MNEKEFNSLILAKIVEIANEVFTAGVTISIKGERVFGTFTAAELAKGKNAKGEELTIQFSKEYEDKDFHVEVETFKCSFASKSVFALVWQFEKLAGTRQVHKARFTAVEEREDLVCSFEMYVDKNCASLAKFVSTDDCLRPTLCYIYLDPYNGALVACDGHALREYPVTIVSAGRLPEGLNLFIDPKHIKNLVGRCSVFVYPQEGGFITEVTNSERQSFICDYTDKYPDYRGVYPLLASDGFVKVAKKELKAVSAFVKNITKRYVPQFSMRITAGEDKLILSYRDLDFSQTKTLAVMLEAPAKTNICVGFNGKAFFPILSGWDGGIWFTDPSRATIFDDKVARLSLCMPMLIEDEDIVKHTKLECNIKAINRHEVPAPEKLLPALYIEPQTNVPTFVFALLELITFVCDWFCKDEIRKTVERLKYLADISGIDIAGLLEDAKTEVVNVKEEENVQPTPQPITIHLNPLAFPTPAWLASSNPSPVVIRELLAVIIGTQVIRHLVVGSGTIAPLHSRRRNAFGTCWRRFNRKGSHRIRDGTKSLNLGRFEANRGTFPITEYKVSYFNSS